MINNDVNSGRMHARTYLSDGAHSYVYLCGAITLHVREKSHSPRYIALCLMNSCTPSGVNTSTLHLAISGVGLLQMHGKAGAGARGGRKYAHV
jgi:hypothetical protein